MKKSQPVRSWQVLLSFALPLAGLLLDAFAFYPGFMSPDSLDQFTQALKNSYNDWHPPVMSAFWRLLNFIYPGPQPFFFLQLLLLWSGCGLLMYAWFRRYGNSALILPIIFLMPFVQNFVANIWKDVHLAMSWFLAASILVKARFSQKPLTPGSAFLALLLLCYGCWVRSNAFPGLIPLVFWWLTELRPEKTTSRIGAFLRTAAISILITGGVLVVQTFLHRVVLKANRNYIEYKLFVHDLAGIYAKTGENYYPDFIQSYPRFDTVQLRENYLVSTFDHMWFVPGGNMFPSVNDSLLGIVRNAWLSSIADHPGVYFQNKWEGYLNFLKITESGTKLCTFFPHMQPNDYGIEYRPNALSYWIIKRIWLSSEAFYMIPWFWALLNLLLIPLAFMKNLRGTRIPALSLLASSLFYLLFEFLVFPADTEFRYFYWNCLSVTLAFLLITTEGISRWRASRNSTSA